jgi:hypothetical protein
MTAGDNGAGSARSLGGGTLTIPPEGFEEHDDLRSTFIRELVAQQIRNARVRRSSASLRRPIPLHLIQYWHDQLSVPDDVRECLSSWRRLGAEGFRFSMFNDESAAAYIELHYGAAERAAFACCHHPAMRCDYLRMCVLVAEGGLYVDADDVLLGEGWRALFRDRALKVQPLCYDLRSQAMVSAEEIWRLECSISERIFYVNNDPIAAPPEHPVLCRALRRATARLLGSAKPLEIQSTTGPGNLTASLAAHARDLVLEGRELDFELLQDWGSIAETRWELSYRNDERNWRNANPF